MGLFSSKSTSTTEQTSNNYDMKNQVAAGGVGVSATGGSSVSVSTTDFGTVGKAFDFAAMLAKGAANEAAASGSRNNAIAQSAMDSVQSAYKNTASEVAAAWETSKAGEQKILAFAGLALVAIVAFNAVRKMA